MNGVNSQIFVSVCMSTFFLQKSLHSSISSTKESDEKRKKEKSHKEKVEKKSKKKEKYEKDKGEYDWHFYTPTSPGRSARTLKSSVPKDPDKLKHIKKTNK